MKKTIFIAIIIALGFISCNKSNSITPKGAVTTESRQVDAFNSIAVSSGIELTLTKGTGSLSIETHENIHEYVETIVKDSILTIKPDYYYYIKNPQIKAYVSTEMLQGISLIQGSTATVLNSEVFQDSIIAINVSGGSVLKADTFTSIVTPKLNIALSGAGKITLNTVTDYLNADVKEAGELYVLGDADTCKITISGNSKVITAPGFAKSDFTVNVGGNSHLTASDMLLNRLSINASGKSTLTTHNMVAMMFYATLTDSCKIIDDNLNAYWLQANLDKAASMYVNVADTIKGTLKGNSVLYYRGTPNTSDMQVAEGSEFIKLSD